MSCGIYLSDPPETHHAFHGAVRVLNHCHWPNREALGVHTTSVNVVKLGGLGLNDHGARSVGWDIAMQLWDCSDMLDDCRI